ncbi:MAG: hypothetical protein NUV72_03195 [Bauldia sp.]|nr:hypothetical protein [Bauldia sp.]
MSFEVNRKGCGQAMPPDDGYGAARLVAAIVASAFAVGPNEIRRLGRGKASAAFARQVAIYLSHTRLGFNYTDAGFLFGRDRTTAAHACRTVEDRREDPRVDAILDCLERAIDLWPGLTRGPGAIQ